MSNLETVVIRLQRGFVVHNVVLLCIPAVASSPRPYQWTQALLKHPLLPEVHRDPPPADTRAAIRPDKPYLQLTCRLGVSLSGSAICSIEPHHG